MVSKRSSNILVDTLVVGILLGSWELVFLNGYLGKTAKTREELRGDVVRMLTTLKEHHDAIEDVKTKLIPGIQKGFQDNSDRLAVPFCQIGRGRRAGHQQDREHGP